MTKTPSPGMFLSSGVRGGEVGGARGALAWGVRGPGVEAVPTVLPGDPVPGARVSPVRWEGPTGAGPMAAVWGRGPR